jgi:glycerol-3-phosphate acyltransferase PlsY
VGGVIIIVSHRDNIDRLLKGTERKLGQPAQPATG